MMEYKLLSDEINDLSFRTVTYTIFNKIEEDFFVHECENADKEKYSVDDFEYALMHLSDKDSFLMKMRNKDMLDRINCFKRVFADNQYVKIYSLFEKGEILIVKLKNKPLILNK